MIYGTFLEDTNYVEVIERYYREHDHPDFPITHTGLSLIRDFLEERGSARRPEELATAYSLTSTYYDGWKTCEDQDVLDLLPVLKEYWKSLHRERENRAIDHRIRVFEPKWFMEIYIQNAHQHTDMLEWEGLRSGRDFGIKASHRHMSGVEIQFVTSEAPPGGAMLHTNVTIFIHGLRVFVGKAQRILMLPYFRVAPVNEKATEEAVASLARQVTELCRCMLEIDLKVDKRPDA
ncbi:MAG: hypothetical protein AAFN09_15660 [Pseudomonadota bacterium]